MTFPRLVQTLFAVLLFLLPTAATAKEINVFAAASLKTALDEIGAGWSAPDGARPVMVYAGSSALARQITEGAPADLFISADIPWMDDLDGKGLIDTATRRNLLGNTLVVIAPADFGGSLDLANAAALAQALGDGRLAVADVKAVPAGRYAKAALTAMGLWDSVADRLAQAENVRAALAFVARGEAPFGIVYGSDAIAEPRVKVVATFPDSSHPPIIYPAALVAGRDNADARAFLDHLSSPAAAAVFARNGFTILTAENP